jgi:acyl-CoA synthetase (AMP-forming)/AMP-acid ligase II
MTTVVPELNPSRPAEVDPAKIVQAIRENHVTNSFGSPTLWRKIFDHCLAHNLELPSLQRVLCAGAAVPASLWRDARRVLPNGELHSPYGATEVLPVATASAREVPADSVAGSLIGRPLLENRVKIIALHEGPLATLDAVRELPPGEVGEIIVTGPTVTKEYDALPEATAAAKIRDGATTWHRMGDAGYLDAAGRLWFCGRIAERVETAAGIIHTEPVEQVFRTQPHVARCALIGLGPRGQQKAALVVQPDSGECVATEEKRHQLALDLLRAGDRHPHTRSVLTFYFHPRLPVDVRHNAKIHRLALARWAAGERAIVLSPLFSSVGQP